MTSRKYLSKVLEKRLFQEVGSKCPICGETYIESLIIHHIVPYSKNEEHNFDDMIVLCGGCHSKADSEAITRTDLYKMKKKLLLASSNVVDLQAFRNKADTNKNTSGSNITVKGNGNVAISENSVVHGDINVTNLTKTNKKAQKGPIIIPGTIGDDARKYGYMNYLVKRYNEYKEWECKTSDKAMKYAMIRVSYQRKFKYDVKDTPLDHFKEAVSYLQERIRKTKIGRINNSKGMRLYRELDEFDTKGDGDGE